MPVEYQEETFDCFIQDQKTGDKYSASVRVKKRRPLDVSRKEGKMKLCDIFVDSVSAVEGQKHHHFAMHTLNGEGIYIFRVGKEDESERPLLHLGFGPRIRKASDASATKDGINKLRLISVTVNFGDSIPIAGKFADRVRPGQASPGE